MKSGSKAAAVLERVIFGSCGVYRTSANSVVLKFRFFFCRIVSAALHINKMRGHVVGLKAVAPDWLRGSGLWFMVAVIKEAHLIADNELNATLPAPCKRGIQGG